MTEGIKDDKVAGEKPTKMNNLMDAASALTALGDEEGSRPSSPSGEAKNSAAKESASDVSKETSEAEKINEKQADEADDTEEESEAKRYLPDHKKPDAAPTFPEKLMKMMKYADAQEKGFCISWLEDGKSFVISDPDKFTRQVVPKFFKQTKFTSFTRKLYRWGFRQVNRGIGPDDPIIFGNEYFQREDAELMTKMRSTTAASTRKQQESLIPAGYAGMKRGFDNSMDDSAQKRMMFDYLPGKQAATNFMQGSGFYGGVGGTGEPLSLTNALYPGMATMGMGQNMMGMGQNMMGMNGNNNHKLNNAVGFTGNGMMNQFMSPPQQGNMQMMQQQQQGGMQMQQQQQPQGNQFMGNQTSTADIVNAAISALRYAN